jgi:hypothetical protein
LLCWRPVTCLCSSVTSIFYVVVAGLCRYSMGQIYRARDDLKQYSRPSKAFLWQDSAGLGDSRPCRVQQGYILQ